MTVFPKLTLVIGGAASGKSNWAESLVVASGRVKTYVATSRALDAEMSAKIARHRAARGDDWQTVEAPFDLVGSLQSTPPDEIVLIDCLTMWLSNHLLDDRGIKAETDELIAALDDMASPLVIVTNDVGGGIVPDNALARRFQTEQGVLNQRVTARADLVVLVTAGLPLALKGAIPGAGP